jgi:hypothetical protein
VALTDITERSSKMPVDAGILYPVRPAPNWDSPAYRGLVRIDEAGLFWVSAWNRIVNGKLVLELKFDRKEDR